MVNVFNVPTYFKEILCKHGMSFIISDGTVNFNEVLLLLFKEAG